MSEIQPLADAAQEPAQPRLSVHILSYNRIRALRRCIEALERSQGRELFRIIVLDCGSRDGSATIDGEYPEITMQRMPRNFGATKALNVGFRTDTLEYLLWLEPEVEVKPDTVAGLLRLIDSLPDAAAVCPLLVDPEGKPVSPLYPIPTKKSLAYACRVGELPERLPVPAGDGPQPVDYPGRRALLFRRKFVQGMNYLDEHYGHAWADAELAFQIWHAQKKILLAPALVAVDHSSSDEPIPWTDSQRAALSADYIHGAARYVRKRYGLVAGALFRVSMILHVLGKVLTFQEIGYNFSRLSGLLSGQKIDGSQSAL